MVLDVFVDGEVVVLRGDLLAGDDPGEILHVPEVGVEGVEAVDVGVGKDVLGAARGEDLRAVHHEDAVDVSGGLDPAQNEDAGGELRPVEDLVSEGDDGLDEVGADEPLADFALGAAAEEDALRKHDGHPPATGAQGLDHVLDPGVVAVGGRRGAPEVAPVGVGRPARRAPVVEGEGRIGDHAVERCQTAALQDLRGAERVALHDAEVRRAVEEEVHLRDGGVHRVLLLAEDQAEAELGVPRVVDRLDQHAAGAAGGVVDALAGLRVEDADEEADHRAGRVELACLGLGLVGELLEQDFVGVAHQVGGVVAVSEPAAGEVLDEIAEAFVADDGLVREVRRREGAQHAVERIGVRLFNQAEGLDDRGAEVFAALPDLLPVAALGNHEEVLFGQAGVFDVAAGLLERGGVFLVPDVAEPLVVEQGREVVLEALVTDGAAQIIARLVQEIVEVLRAGQDLLGLAGLLGGHLRNQSA